MSRVRILLADDHAVLREGLRMVLEREPDFQVVAEASDGQEAVEKTRMLRPDLVLIDIAMPRMNGVEATRRIKRHCPETKVLVLTQYDDRAYVLPILQAGADGYILKQSDSQDLVEGIRAVLRGEASLSPPVARQLMDLVTSEPQAGSEAPEVALTDREREVLILIAEGYSTRQIAELLGISPKTVDVHRTNLMRKLNLHNRVEVTRYAIRHGFISPREPDAGEAVAAGTSPPGRSTRVMPVARSSGPPPEEAPRPTRALVRSPGQSFARALSMQSPRPRIDVALAQAQHAAYVDALRACGLEVTALPPDEAFPDACFVQDLAVLYEDLAVICRPGAPSRQGEEVAIAEALRPYKRVVRIQAPGTLEGGDVLRVGRHLFVGLSGRTNQAGVAQLREFLEPLGATVTPVPVQGSLHLLSDCTYLGRGMLLAAGAAASRPEFLGLDVIFVPPEEAYAANCLAIGDHVILPEGYPRVRNALEERGFRVITVPLTEFQKADGGATCLSLLW